jgi:3-oxoacyl-ACP reductase-like protein
VAAAVVASPPPTTIAGPAASIEDVPIRAVDILAVIVSQKLKKQLSEVPLSKSIKELSNGKSTLQNEIMGDLQGEFSSAPDKGEELPLEELGAALGSGHSGNLGKYSTGLVACHWRQDAWWLQYFKCEISSLQDMGSGSSTCGRCATHCYNYGARQTPWF